MHGGALHQHSHFNHHLLLLSTSTSTTAHSKHRMTHQSKIRELCRLKDNISASTTTSVAQSLPEDVLYATFLSALPSSFNFYLSSDESFNKTDTVAPLNFSWVCRSWRTLILSRPKLWSEIHIVGDFRSDEDKDKEENEKVVRLQRCVGEWLSRSRPSPLIVDLAICGYEEDHFKEFIPLFLSESDRFSSIHMDVHYCFTLSGFARTRTPISFPCSPTVTSLRLNFKGANPPKAIIDLSRAVHGVDLPLEYLSLHSRSSVLPSCRDALYLPCLRHLNYSSTEEEEKDERFQQLICILCASPNLERLTLAISGESDFALASNHGRKPIHLPRLTTFELSVSDRLSNNYFLQVLEFPSLRNLTIIISSGDQDAPTPLEPEQIHDFLAHQCSNPPLEILILNGGDFRPTPAMVSSLRNLLSLLEGLEALSLGEVIFNRSVLEMLTVPSGDSLESPLCPSLSEIWLCRNSYQSELKTHDFAKEDIDELIVSRWKAGSLRRAIIECPLFGGMKERERIVECVREGLSLQEFLLQADS
ncbi:hypothetical protein SCHPADRAFT_162715 [Schizopora paradoxa]|uniref:F-box domain-containing protein n=1 Tax=Schizopora paradoxa TaxID=27342 RepID=A0A0H2S0G7_9AGAM|nr:hypothetical protein SCHPADRAFT_162715 [Schizopora paradoxa]